MDTETLSKEEAKAKELAELTRPKIKQGRPRGLFYQDLSTPPKKTVHPLAKRPPGVKNHLYFVGIKQETTRWSPNVFAGNIVVKTPNHPRNGVVCFKDYYGFDVNPNDLRAFAKICEFYSRAIEDIIMQDPEAEFMFYNQQCFLEPSVLFFRKFFICTNNESIVSVCNYKYSARERFKDFAQMLEYKSLYKYEITPFLLDRAFGEKYDRWVIQEPVGFAGLGTFLMDRKNYTRVRLRIKERFAYQVCRYVEDNIPVNVHFMIGEDSTIIFDATVQKLRVDQRIQYSGWSFEEFEVLPKSTQEKVYQATKRLAQGLKEKKYVGIGGVDFVVDKDENIWFMEVNPRFQSSSEGLDKRLQAKGFPSLFRINLMCFQDKKEFDKLAKQLSH